MSNHLVEQIFKLQAAHVPCSWTVDKFLKGNSSATAAAARTATLTATAAAADEFINSALLK